MDFKFAGKHYAEKTDLQMKDVLMEPNAPGPSVHYYMIRGGKEQKNITILEAGTIGGEYIKTYGHYHLDDLEETYWILFGEGVILLQKMALDLNGKIIADKVLEFKAIKLKQGDSVDIPKGFGHVLINTGNTFLVTADNTDVIFDEERAAKTKVKTDYESVKKMHGFAYYVIKEKEEVKLIKNSNYHEQINKVSLELRESLSQPVH